MYFKLIFIINLELEEMTKQPDKDTLKTLKNLTDHDVAISITFQI